MDFFLILNEVFKKNSISTSPSPITSLCFYFALSDEENHIEKVITYQGRERGGSLERANEKG